MENVIGIDKQFIIIERESLKELSEYSNRLSTEPGVFSLGKSEGIKYVIEWMKQNNIYNEKDFHYIK